MQRLVGENRKTLITQLKTTYKVLYDRVQPIPYIRDKLYCVDKVFIEGSSEHLPGRSTVRGKHTTWVRFDSYVDIYNDPADGSKRFIIEGEPGFGKTTYSLQFTYDWSTGVKGSPFSDVEILILLRLRQLRGVKNIFRAIKWYLLPSTSQLKSSDIEEIFRHTSSIAILLDGWDEYPEQDTANGSEIRRIIMAELFPDYDVTLTTRYLPKKFAEATRRVRLIGFDDKARDQYIRKAVVGDDDEAAEQIKRRLQDNPVLADLCQVPLFFVMFAHMAHEKEEFKRFRSVTDFFVFMITCFHEHLRNKEEDSNVQKHNLKYESDHNELDDLAYEGLTEPDQQLVWSKQELYRRLGQGFYDHYKRLGILVEEEVFCHSQGFNPADADSYTTEVRFYHKLFCEWYAAHHVSQLAVTVNDDELSQSLEKMDPFDLQYVYRFACGLLPDAGGKIISYLKSIEDGDKFAVLCILEQTGEVEDIKETIRELCSRSVIIQKIHTKLLQRSTIQLLDIASSHNIPITEVHMYGLSPVADQSGSSLTISSQLSLPVLATLRKLQIWHEDRMISNDEVLGILRYISQCASLRELRFLGHDPPGPVQGAESVLSVLRSRNVKVRLDPSFGRQYSLDLTSGKWKWQM